jgi:predicted hotdog family 3-hydroxylacyl-ACP dehydratase
VNTYTISEVLTHTPPMILIDKLTHYTESSAQAEVTIGPHSAFFNEQQNAVPSYVGIEYMAQTIAACAGANDLDNQRDKKIGFLLGSRKYQTQTSWFNTGDTLVINIEKLHQEDTGLGVFDCVISRHDQVLVQAKVNVFQPSAE